MARSAALDIDPRNSGDYNLERLADELGPLPHTVESQTGGGGRHLLFRHPAGLKFKGKLACGVDLKSENGYIVAPPSLHPSGRRYTWEASSRPGDVELAALPNRWIGAALRFDAPIVPSLAITDVGDSFLARAFGAAGWIKRRIDTTRLAVRCPWEHEHSKGAGSFSSTIVFASTRGWFHCSHSHCEGRRSFDDVVRELPRSALNAALAASLRIPPDIEERMAIQEEGR